MPNSFYKRHVDQTIRRGTFYEEVGVEEQIDREIDLLNNITGEDLVGMDRMEERNLVKEKYGISKWIREKLYSRIQPRGPESVLKNEMPKREIRPPVRIND